MEKRRADSADAPISAGHFEEKIENLSSFQLENIVTVHGAGFWHSDQYDLHAPALITEYVSGPTLKQVIDNETLETWLSAHLALLSKPAFLAHFTSSFQALLPSIS